MRYLTRLKAFKPLALNIAPREALRATCGALFAICLVMLLSRLLFGQPTTSALMAALGASSVLAFLTPSTPLAHPWSLLSGNLLAAALAITASLWIDDSLLRLGATLSACMLCLLALRCLHPPSCALAVAIALNESLTLQWGYGLLAPVALNTLTLLAVALLYNNLTGQRYPRQPLPAPRNRHHTTDLPSWQRTQLQEQDLQHALNTFGRYVDVRIEDLTELLQLTEQQAFTRMSNHLTAGQIMSRDVVTASPKTSIEFAWAMLAKHRLEALPIVDADHTLVGIVTLVDFLNQKSFARMPRRRWNLSRGSRQRPLEHIMTAPVVSAREDTSILDLVLQLSHNSLHHLPVVDEQQHVIGIISQTDIINALYRLLVQRCHVGSVAA
ncbi:MAG: HPP family protein [Thiopseudomonas sp.]|nr:HPP family protein [Thiopseudomonas sp.]